jgi:uncharacterized protein (DUF1015 family)
MGEALLDPPYKNYLPLAPFQGLRVNWNISFTQKEHILADIRPFQGIHYNPSIVKDMAKVICPPYDIIPLPLQQELHRRSDYNFVRIEYGFETPHDSSTDNKYTRAASFMEDMLNKKVLAADTKPAIYVDEHTFNYQGKARKRHTITAVVKLEEWSKMVIRPHEGTMAKAKSDRLNMLYTLHANTSPIMALYEDKKAELKAIIDKQLKNKPLLNVDKYDGESHLIWAIDDEDAISRIHGQLADQPLYIADGHHRYESALNYQRERRSTTPNSSNPELYDFVMMTMIDMADPGLVILPAHRLVDGLSSAAIEGLAAKLPSFFNIKETRLDKTNINTQISGLLQDNKNGQTLILCGLKKDTLLSLTLRDPESVRSMFPAFHSDIYQKLDVSIVDHVILEELLGITQEQMGSFLNWVHEPALAVEKVLKGECQLSIIVNPVKPGAIKAIADVSDRMPKKSTYFYPKVPAGLVSYHF